MTQQLRYYRGIKIRAELYNVNEMALDRTGAYTYSRTVISTLLVSRQKTL